jgi:hypothetical protein
MSDYYISNANFKIRSRLTVSAKCLTINYNIRQTEAHFDAVFGIALDDATTVQGSVNPLQSQTTLVAKPTIIAPPVKRIAIDWACIGVHWKPEHTYRFVFKEDFIREKTDLFLSNLDFEKTYTTNPLPVLLGSDPAFGSTNIENNTKIDLVFDRLMRPGLTGNLYLWEEAGATDILLGTFDVNMDVEQSNNANSLSTFSIDTTGLLKSNKTYYVTSDVKVFRDFDEFYYPQLAVGDYTFSTAVSTGAFPDLISFVMSSGTLAFSYIRYRNTESNFETVDSTLTAPEYWRVRQSESDFENVVSNFGASLKYANATTNTTISSEFEFVDIFISYTAGGRANLTSAADISSIIGAIKQYLSALSSSYDLTFNYIRYRDFTSSVSSDFSNSNVVEYGVLQTTRGSDTYSTNTTTTISLGPRFEAKAFNTRTGNGYTGYTMVVRPDDLNAVSSLFLSQLYYERLQTVTNRSIRSYNTEQNYIISDDGNIFIIPPNYENLDIATGCAVYKKVDGYYQDIQTISVGDNLYGSIALSGDGLTLAIASSYGSDVEIYTWDNTSNNFVSQATIAEANTNTQFGQALSFSTDGNTLAIGEPGTLSDPPYAGAVYVYTRSGSTWSLQTTLTKTGTTNYPLYGWRVSLSANGNTLAVGSPFDAPLGGGSQSGAVYVYTRSGSTWSLQEKVQDVTNPDLSLRWGYRLDLSSDGNTFVTNGEMNSTTNDLAKVFIRSGSTWSLQTSINLDSSINPNTQVVSLNLANSGNTLIAGVTGAPAGEGYPVVTPGTTRIYTRSGTTWTEKTVTNLTAFGEVGAAISESENLILTSTLTPASGATEFNIFTPVTASFNSSTKTLTFSGTRSYCRTQTDLIQYTPATDYTGNFNLIYTGTIPDGRTTTRTQDITRV